MWLEIINNYNENNESILDFNFELHQCMYIKTLLKNSFIFELNNVNNLIIKKDKKSISNEELFYWWQFTRFNELFKEEKDIFDEFNKLKDKINKASAKIKTPEFKNTDTDKDKLEKQNTITENKVKIEKLNNHLKVEADKSNQQINLLKNFRLMIPNFVLFERLLINIKIILMNS
jgi:hypothetical protein